MSNFTWMYHTVEVEYPESGFRARLGGSYQYSAPPAEPDQRVFKLKFLTMRYYTNGDGSINLTTDPTINFAALEAFYNAHKLHYTFIYPHPVYGNVPVKFNKPLKVPEGIPGGGGALKSFELEFIEVPGTAASF